MDLSEIKEVKQVRGDIQINECLRDGWIIVQSEIITENHANTSKPCIVVHALMGKKKEPQGYPITDHLNDLP